MSRPKVEDTDSDAATRAELRRLGCCERCASDLVVSCPLCGKDTVDKETQMCSTCKQKVDTVLICSFCGDIANG